MNKQHWFARQVRILPCAATLGLLLLGACSPKSDTPAGAGAPDTNAATQAAASPAPKPEFKRLEGRWERPDGGYVLELKDVDASGNFKAGYFNPNPINVSKALALRDSSATKLFVELRDVNYPGCTYSLTYDANTDQLYGQYFQASMQQTYDVTFARLKD